MSIKNLLITMALAALPFAQGVAQTPEEAVSKYGKIILKQDAVVGGLTAWTVEKAGKQVVLYTTPQDEKMAVIAGLVWDAQGEEISKYPLRTLWSAADAERLEIEAPNATLAEVSSAAAMDGSFVGEIPQSMQTVDALQGVKEGQGGIADTVYVIIDPRCPYCRQAYELTRPYVAKGHTIKWIPTAALGDRANGVPLAATILTEKDPEVLARVLGQHQKIKTQPTPDIEKALDLNLAFMFAAFEQNGGQAGVPVAFYIDHRTGKPKMMQGLSDEVVLHDIFGKL